MLALHSLVRGVAGHAQVLAFPSVHGYTLVANVERHCENTAANTCEQREIAICRAAREHVRHRSREINALTCSTQDRPDTALVHSPRDVGYVDIDLVPIAALGDGEGIIEVPGTLWVDSKRSMLVEP